MLLSLFKFLFFGSPSLMLKTLTQAYFSITKCSVRNPATGPRERPQTGHTIEPGNRPGAKLSLRHHVSYVQEVLDAS